MLHDIARGLHDIARALHDIARGPHDIARVPHDIGRGRHDIGRVPHDIGRGPHDIGRGWHDRQGGDRVLVGRSEPGASLTGSEAFVMRTGGGAPRTEVLCTRPGRGLHPNRAMLNADRGSSGANGEGADGNRVFVVANRGRVDTATWLVEGRGRWGGASCAGRVRVGGAPGRERSLGLAGMLALAGDEPEVAAGSGAPSSDRSADCRRGGRAMRRFDTQAAARGCLWTVHGLLVALRPRTRRYMITLTPSRPRRDWAPALRCRVGVAVCRVTQGAEVAGRTP